MKHCRNEPAVTATACLLVLAVAWLRQLPALMRYGTYALIDHHHHRVMSLLPLHY